MRKLKLAVLASLACSTLLASTAWGRDGPGGYGPGATRETSDFSFNMGFNGRSRTHHQVSRRPVVLHGVNFRFDSAELTSQSSKILDVVASTLRNQPTGAMEIGGHASAEGDDRYNLDLSARRARAVRSYLIRQGVPANRLTSNGYGETRPLINNVSESGRSVNRRVELTPVHLAAAHMQ